MYWNLRKRQQTEKYFKSRQNTNEIEKNNEVTMKNMKDGDTDDSSV